MSKTQKLVRYMQNGAEVTARQIQGTFGFKNPGRVVHYLREQGYCVYSNSAKLSTGERVVKYRIGKPSKSMIAFVASKLGAEAFTR